MPRFQSPQDSIDGDASPPQLVQGVDRLDRLEVRMAGPSILPELLLLGTRRKMMSQEWSVPKVHCQ